MPPLKNTRRERFAVLVAAGSTQIKAHKDSGYKPNDVRASRLAADPEVAARILELQSTAANEAMVTIEMVVDELRRVAFSDMSDYLSFGPAGVSLRSSDELNEDAFRSISEVSETVNVTGGSRKFKLHDKLKALELLGKHVGAFKADNDQKEPPGRAVVVMYPANGRD